MFLDNVWDGIKIGSLACLCALGIYCMVVGAITTVDQLAAHITAGCEKEASMALTLTPEQIDRLIQQADGLAPKEGSIFRALVKLTEAEVRKEYTEQIQQLVEALEYHRAQTRPIHQTNEAIIRGRARLQHLLEEKSKEQ